MKALDIFDTTFVGGPLGGKTDRRLIAAPKTWDVYRHRDAGVIEVGSGPYGRQDHLWERFDYRRVISTPVSATYVLAEIPDCFVHRSFGSIYLGTESSHVDDCFDPEHSHFWYPENWPGGRAPAKWVIKDRTEDREEADRLHAEAVAAGKRVGPSDSHFMSDYLTVDLWVPECCVNPDSWAGALWWSSGHHMGRNALSDIQWWAEEERRLAAERDEILDAREALAELQETVGALPG